MTINICSTTGRPCEVSGCDGNLCSPLPSSILPDGDGLELDHLLLRYKYHLKMTPEEDLETSDRAALEFAYNQLTK